MAERNNAVNIPSLRQIETHFRGFSGCFFFDGPAKIPVAPFCVSPKSIRGAFSGVAAGSIALKLPRLSFWRSVKNSSTCLLAVPS